jgi:hypothetical protein
VELKTSSVFVGSRQSPTHAGAIDFHIACIFKWEALIA